MKKILILSVLLAITLPSCKKGYLGLTGELISGGNSNKQYYKGKIKCSYFRRNYNDDLCLQVTGIPFMVFKYDKANNTVTDFEFGLCEVTQTTLASPAFPEPTIGASTLDCYKKLKLKDPTVLLVNWPVTAWGGTVTNGSLNAGGPIFYYSSYGSTKYTFSRLSSEVTGGAENLDGTGIETKTMMDFDMFKE